jgi:hypothetical protein
LHGRINIDIDGTNRKFRIIANPFQQVSQGRGSSRESILAKDSYDVWDLMLEYLPGSGGEPVPIPNGRHILEVAEMVCSGREAILVLRLRPDLSPRARRSKRILEKMAIDGDCDWSLLFDIPLTSCGPSNLVELDIDRIRGRLWELEENIDGSPFLEQREVSVELGTPSPPPAKRRRCDGQFSIRSELRGESSVLEYDVS